MSLWFWSSVYEFYVSCRSRSFIARSFLLTFPSARNRSKCEPNGVLSSLRHSCQRFQRYNNTEFTKFHFVPVQEESQGCTSFERATGIEKHNRVDAESSHPAPDVQWGSQQNIKPRREYDRTFGSHPHMSRNFQLSRYRSSRVLPFMPKKLSITLHVCTVRQCNSKVTDINQEMRLSPPHHACRHRYDDPADERVGSFLYFLLWCLQRDDSSNCKETEHQRIHELPNARLQNALIPRLPAPVHSGKRSSHIPESYYFHHDLVTLAPGILSNPIYESSTHPLVIQDTENTWRVKTSRATDP